LTITFILDFVIITIFIRTFWIRGEKKEYTIDVLTDNAVLTVLTLPNTLVTNVAADRTVLVALTALNIRLTDVAILKEVATSLA